MKKLIFFVVIAVFGFTNLTAQEVNFGAKAGVNFSDITGDDVDSFNGLTSFHVGVVSEIEISDKFSFQPELLYSAQGSDYEDEYEDYTDKGTVKVDYLNLPLMGKFYITEGLSLEAGPQVGFLLCATMEYELIGTGFEEGKHEMNIKDDLKGIDFGANLGLGYKMENGLNFSARYNLGLSDNNDNKELLDDSSYKNSVIQVSVGYFF